MSHRTFEPKTFYELATYVNRLSNIIPQELKQAANRTCISRAYYAVFLSFREKILALPIRNVELRKRIERTNDAHAIVAESIRKIDFNVGDYILNLRAKRNQADYMTNINVTSDDVIYVFKITNEIFHELTAIVTKLKESDILSAWNKIQQERERRYSF
jgi:uncharacterized protein (UPF0332 family)